MKIKILSWNVWVDGYFDEISRFIKDSNAEIICLQEVKDNDSERDVIGFLEKLGYNYAFASTLQTWDGEKYKHGPAVFSRFVIKNSSTHMLSEENVRVVVGADINIGDQILHVFSTHLMHTHQKPSKIQEEQAQNLIELIPKKMAILTGDFNATPESKTIKLLNSVFVDTDKTSSPTWSVYKDGCELCKLDKITTRLDYIFTTKDISSSFFEVGRSRGSDHLPITTIIKI